MIYFAQATGGGLIKIGFSHDPGARMSMLRNPSGERVVLLGVMDGGRKEETEIHAYLEKHQEDREWFRPNRTLMRFIKREARPWRPRPSAHMMHILDKLVKMGYAEYREPDPWQR